jgi:dCTP diphosphatase
MPVSEDSLNQIRQRILTFTAERDWNQFHNPKDLALSLILEAAEVLEHFQWKDQGEVEAHLTQHKNDVAEELCDVLYWVVLMAHEFDIDLPTAFEKKMQKNEAKYPVEKARGNHKKYTQHQQTT